MYYQPGGSCDIGKNVSLTNNKNTVSECLRFYNIEFCNECYVQITSLNPYKILYNYILHLATSSIDLLAAD